MVKRTINPITPSRYPNTSSIQHSNRKYALDPPEIPIFLPPTSIFFAPSPPRHRQRYPLSTLTYASFYAFSQYVCLTPYTYFIVYTLLRTKDVHVRGNRHVIRNCLFRLLLRGDHLSWPGCAEQGFLPRFITYLYVTGRTEKYLPLYKLLVWRFRWFGFGSGPTSPGG